MTLYRVTRLVWPLLLALSLALAGHAGIALGREAASATPDLGDAPDSTNDAGATMTAYPGVPAAFPTTFATYQRADPPGPLHHNDRLGFYLGTAISAEGEADTGPDDDGRNNIDPAADRAGQDGADDGLTLPERLPHCELVNATFYLTLPAGQPAAQTYVNLWVDWNRDGRWAVDVDTLCATGPMPNEWAVRNQEVELIRPGTIAVRSTAFRVWNPDPSQPMWVRVSLSDEPAPGGPLDLAQGPVDGYALGETEDTLLPGVVAETTVQVIQSDNQGFAANVIFPERTPRAVAAPGGITYTEMLMPGLDVVGGNPDLVGQPAVPILNRLLAIPRNGLTPTLRLGQISYSRHVTCSWPCFAPAQPSPIDLAPTGEDADFGDPPFVIDRAAYAEDRDFPQKIASVRLLGRLRDVDVVQLSVASGQFNPVQGVFRPFQSVEVWLDFEGGEGTFLNRQALGVFESHFDPIWPLLLNGEAVVDPEYVDPDLPLASCIGYEFLIIVDPAYRAAADALKAWKVSKGIATLVVETGNGPGDAGTTAEEIRAFIQDEYNRCLVRPSYLLLFGDSQHIPPWTVQVSTTEDDEGNTIPVFAPSDLPYVTALDGSQDDVFFPLPYLAHGRIPVTSLSQAETVVDKIIAYESAPPTVGSFYQEMTFASYFQCCWWSQPDGTTTRGYVQTSEQVRSYLVGQGFGVERVYASDADYYQDASEDDYYDLGTRDDTPRFYRNGGALPGAIGPGSGFAWDGDTQDIKDAFADGRFLIFHRDHGNSSGWGDPPFDSGDAGALSNGALQPVVFSINCSTGYFDNNTSFAETLLRHGNGGAVGVIAATRVTPTWENNALSRGLFDAIWPGFLPGDGGPGAIVRLGDIHNYAKLYMLNQTWQPQPAGSLDLTDVRRNFYLYHVIGDPTLEIWLENPNFNPPLTFGFHAPPPDPDDLVWLLNYPEDDVIITVLQDGRPLGRAPVMNGVAEIPFLTEYDPALPLEVSAYMAGAIPTPLVNTGLTYLSFVAR